MGPIIGTTAFVAIEEGEVIVVAFHTEIDAGDEVGKLGFGKEIEALVVYTTQRETS